MAYNSFYPNYNYPTYPNYPQYQPQQIPQTQQTPQMPQQTPQQIQNGGFVSVRSELEARNYAVAPGNSITFIDETAPYCYTKTMGFSQLDRPKFEKYRLVKEEETPITAPTSAETPSERKDTAFITRVEFDSIAGEIQAITNNMDGFANNIGILRKEIADLKAKTDVKRNARTKKEGDEA